MKVCFYFQVHQPERIKPFSFFDINQKESYWDDGLNKLVVEKVADKCYIPMNELLLNKIKEHNGNFKCSFSISGTALNQFEKYRPDVISSFENLAESGAVEFLAETSHHSLAAIYSDEVFHRQVNSHVARIGNLFGKEPQVFRNTELIFNNRIAWLVKQMGFKGMLLEGTEHVLGDRSPNHVYHAAYEPSLPLLCRNSRLSDDIGFRFSNKGWKEFPLTSNKFMDWLAQASWDGECMNLFMDYETFGEHQWEDTGIFDFMSKLIDYVCEDSYLEFATPSEVIQSCKSIGPVDVVRPTSWADQERDISAWLGNPIQDDAFRNIARLYKKIEKIDNDLLLSEYDQLSTSDHFYYMCTKYFSDGDVHMYFNHYETPFEAYINYMNVLADFEMRLDQELLKKTNEKTSSPKTGTKVKLELDHAN